MKKLVFAIMFLFCAGIISAQDTTNQEPKLKLIALKFYADWCPTCKTMEPIFTDLSNKFDNSSVLFVTLDFTNKTTRQNANLTMQALGLSHLLYTYKGTGYIVLVDPTSGKALEIFTIKLTFDEMCALIKQHL